MLRTATLMGRVPGLANLMEQYTRLSRTHRLATVMIFAPAALAIGIWVAAVTLPVAQLTAVMIGGQFQSPHLLITAPVGQVVLVLSLRPSVPPSYPRMILSGVD